MKPRLIRIFILFYMSRDLPDEKDPLDSHRSNFVAAIRSIQLALSAAYTKGTGFENFDFLNIFFTIIKYAAYKFLLKVMILFVT